jgi:hypothetical protein
LAGVPFFRQTNNTPLQKPSHPPHNGGRCRVQAFLNGSISNSVSEHQDHPRPLHVAGGQSAGLRHGVQFFAFLAGELDQLGTKRHTEKYICGMLIVT